MSRLIKSMTGVGVACAMLLAGCTASGQGDGTVDVEDGASPVDPAASEPSEPAQPPESIEAVFSNIAETPTLDPAVAFSSDGILFVRNVYEGLLEYAPGSTELRPLLATEWEVGDDGVTYTFTLRDDVVFHDGSSLTAEVAKRGLERIQEVNQGPASLMGSIDTIEAQDDQTLVITLNAPDFYFLGTLPKLPIVSLEAWEANATDDDPLASEFFATESVGSGPYQLQEWQRNQAIQLAAYDDYWREFEPGTPTDVTLRVDPDISTAMQLLAAGEIDMMGAVGPDESAQAEAMPGVTLVEQPSFEVRMLNLNTTKPPLDDPKVREAITLAFDYQAMVDFFQGYGEVPRGPLPSALEGQGELPEPVSQDMDRARELLAEAGFPDGGFSVEFLGLAGLSYQEFAANVLEEQLGELGIDVEQNLNPWPQMVEIQSNPDTAEEVSFLNQSVFTADPTYLLRSAYSTATHADKGGYNWSYYSNPQIDSMLDEVRTLPTEEERAAMISEMVDIIKADHVAVYVVEPALAQPVREGWDVTYETLDYNYVVRFFYARQT